MFKNLTSAEIDLNLSDLDCVEGNINGSVVTSLPAVVNSHYMVTVQSQCSDCAQQVTDGEQEQEFCSDYTAIGSSILLAVINSHYTVTAQSQCSDCAQQGTDGIGVLLCTY